MQRFIGIQINFSVTNGWLFWCGYSNFEIDEVEVVASSYTILCFANNSASFLLISRGGRALFLP
jgi:hypothetical protein